MAKVLYIRADIFQPSGPLEVTTLYSCRSRGKHGLLPLLVTAKKSSPLFLVTAEMHAVFSITEGYGQQPPAGG